MITKALKLFCPRAAKWIQVHFQKKNKNQKEVEQTKVSQFLPCDSESFPRNIWDYWVYTHYISSSIVLPREHLTFCHSDEDVQDQRKNTQKTWQSWILIQTTSLLHPIENIFSAKEMLSQFQTSSPDTHDVCSYCCREPGVAARAAQAKEEESKEQARQGVITDSFLSEWKHRDFAQIPWSVVYPESQELHVLVFTIHKIKMKATSLWQR